jgi:peptidoglycan-associated lipoprotein
MNTSSLSKLTPLIVLLSVLGLAAGCSHKKPKSDETAAAPSIDSSELGSSDEGKAYGLKTVHFAFDSNLLDKGAKSLLARDAEIMKSHGAVRFQIEGNCDTRGGIQYNIALGEKRADSVKKYLEDLGVPANQLLTVSYGKERPLDSANTETAFAKNRRADFVVTAK